MKQYLLIFYNSILRKLSLINQMNVELLLENDMFSSFAIQYTFP